MARDKAYFGRLLFPDEFSRGFSPLTSHEGLDKISILLVFCFLFLSWIEGVLQEWYVAPLLDADFYADITEEMDNQWKRTHDGKNVRETIKEWLVKYIGEPINQMLR